MVFASAIGLLAAVTTTAWANNYATNSPGVAQALGAGAPAAASNAHARSSARATGGAGGSASVVNNVSGGAGGGSSGGGGIGFALPSQATTNACGGGISLGGVGMGGGGGGGALWELHDCRLRQAAVLLDARGDHAAARNVWCQISEVRVAYKQAGQPCPDDQPKVQQVSAPADRLPDWCATTSGRDPAVERDTCAKSLNAALAHLSEDR
jgi:hypothetical protein